MLGWALKQGTAAAASGVAQNPQRSVRLGLFFVWLLLFHFLQSLFD